jgi:hypothetical protein
LRFPMTIAAQSGGVSVNRKLRKAGRYKLAALVSKTGSVSTEVGALPTPSAKS